MHLRGEKAHFDGALATVGLMNLKPKVRKVKPSGLHASGRSRGGWSVRGCSGLPGWGRTDGQIVNLSCPPTSLFSTWGKVGPCEGHQDQLVNVKNMNIPPYNMSWAF